MTSGVNSPAIMETTTTPQGVNIELLRGISMFAKLTDSELAELSAYLRPRPVVANQTLFWVGDRGTDFLLIQSGEIELFYLDDNGKEQPLATLKPGQFFGELSLLDGGPRTATARGGVDGAALLSLGRSDFERFLLSHAAAAFHILVVLGQRQREMLDKLRGIKNANEVVREKTSRWHRISDVVARVMSSPYFIMGQICIVAAWVYVNHAEGNGAFDAYPFNLLSLVLAIEALFLSAFLLVSQGRQDDRDRVQADLDYQVNLKAHMEVVQLHEKIDRIENILRHQQTGGE
jgi:uncharacterized membrane protein